MTTKERVEALKVELQREIANIERHGDPMDRVGAGYGIIISGNAAKLMLELLTRPPVAGEVERPWLKGEGIAKGEGECGYASCRKQMEFIVELPPQESGRVFGVKVCKDHAAFLMTQFPIKEESHE